MDSFAHVFPSLHVLIKLVKIYEPFITFLIPKWVADEIALLGLDLQNWNLRNSPILKNTCELLHLVFVLGKV